MATAELGRAGRADRPLADLRPASWTRTSYWLICAGLLAMEVAFCVRVRVDPEIDPAAPAGGVVVSAALLYGAWVLLVAPRLLVLGELVRIINPFHTRTLVRDDLVFGGRQFLLVVSARRGKTFTCWAVQATNVAMLQSGPTVVERRADELNALPVGADVVRWSDDRVRPTLPGFAYWVPVAAVLAVYVTLHLGGWGLG